MGVLDEQGAAEMPGKPDQEGVQCAGRCAQTGRNRHFSGLHKNFLFAIFISPITGAGPIRGPQPVEPKPILLGYQGILVFLFLFLFVFPMVFINCRGACIGFFVCLVFRLILHFRKPLDLEV